MIVDLRRQPTASNIDLLLPQKRGYLLFEKKTFSYNKKQLKHSPRWKVCEYNQIYGKVKKMRVILLVYKGRRRQRWLDKRWFIKSIISIYSCFPIHTSNQKSNKAWKLSRYPKNICVGCTIMLKKIDQKLLLTTTKQNLLAKGVCYHYHYSLLILLSYSL